MEKIVTRFKIWVRTPPAAWALTVGTATAVTFAAIHVIFWHATVAAAVSVHEVAVSFAAGGSVVWGLIAGFVVYVTRSRVEPRVLRFLTAVSRKIADRRDREANDFIDAIKAV